jgi:hypothetical protein
MFITVLFIPVVYTIVLKMSNFFKLQTSSLGKLTQKKPAAKDKRQG